MRKRAKISSTKIKKCKSDSCVQCIVSKNSLSLQIRELKQTNGKTGKSAQSHFIHDEKFVLSRKQVCCFDDFGLPTLANLGPKVKNVIK